MAAKFSELEITGPPGPPGPPGSPGAPGAPGKDGSGTSITGTNTQTLRFDGTTLTASSALLNNGTQVSVGGSPSAASRLTLTPTGATENGLNINMGPGSTGDPFTITKIGTDSKTTIAPGFMAISSADGPGNFYVYGTADAYQYANFGLIDNTGGSSAGNPYWYFSYKSAALARVFQMNYFTGINGGSQYKTILQLNTDGTAATAGYKILYDNGGQVSGYSGNVPANAQSIHFQGGICVGYTDSTGNTVGS